MGEGRHDSRVVFSVNSEDVDPCQCFREIVAQFGVCLDQNCHSRFLSFEDSGLSIFWWWRARARGHYQGFACGYPWRGETSRGGERRPPLHRDACLPVYKTA